MARPHAGLDRRTFLAAMALPLFTTRGLYAEQLFASPSLTEGPFYPDHLPLDQDNDLILIKDDITPAVGEITHLSGRILDLSGAPLKDVTIEIWQCDAKQVYLHSADSKPKAAQQDRHFQGFGRFTTASTGEYRFRTIKPVEYPGRPAPHIHIKLKRGDRELLTTQLLMRGYPGNEKDGIYNDLTDPLDKELVLADWIAVPDAKVPEWKVNFDLVLGRTPDENDLSRPRG